MSTRNFRKMLEAQWSRGNFVCVGLDCELAKIPESARKKDGYGDLRVTDTICAFNHAIVEATKDLVCAYKPNIAFYEALGSEGIRALQQTIANIHAYAPDVPVILDAKRGDIGNTNAGYVDSAFSVLNADAITVHPYLGREAMQPFLDCKDKGIFVLCRTSNPGADEFQGMEVCINARLGFYGPLCQLVAGCVSRDWNVNGNCALVVGATAPEELRQVREIVGDMPILIPGIGAQGGDVGRTVSAGKDSRGQGMIINSSRGIIFASNGSDFAEAARRETLKLHHLINHYRQ